MTDKPTIRASSVWLHLLCPGSVHTEQDDVRLNVGSAPASAGTAAHRCSEALVTTGSIVWDAIPEVVRKYNVDEDELRMLCAMATKLWREVAESFPNAMTEVSLEYESDLLRVTGHADMVSIGGSVGRIGDWKFGYKDSWIKPQLLTYAALLLLSNPELTQATGTGLWVRDGEAENYTLGPMGAREWFERLEHMVVGWDGVYRVGDHCEWCPRAHCCPAGRALAKRDVAAFLDTEAEESLALMAPDQIITTLAMSRRVARYADACAKAIKAHVRTHGSVIGSEQELLIKTEQRRALKPVEALGVLRDDFGLRDDDLVDCVKLRLGAIEQVIAKRAGRGKGAAAKRDLQARLEEADAIVLNTIEELTTRRL
jgi:hypothetical protein